MPIVRRAAVATAIVATGLTVSAGIASAATDDGSSGSSSSSSSSSHSSSSSSHSSSSSATSRPTRLGSTTWSPER